MAFLATKSSGFWQLPDVIKAYIFEYDDTYKNIMQKDVSLDLWRSAWIRERNAIDCDYYKLVYDHLFYLWGVYEDSAIHSSDVMYHCSRNYLPGNYKMILDFNESLYKNMGVSVRVESTLDGTCAFDGWILNESEHRETSWLENRVIGMLETCDVHWDKEMGLYLWENYHR